MKIKVNPLDSAFSKYVRLLADDKCEYCGEASTQVHHFHGRRKLSTRYDRDNVCSICFVCHQGFHEHPNIATDFFKKRLGSERYEQLNIRSQMIKKMSKQDKKDLMIFYKEQIKLAIKM